MAMSGARQVIQIRSDHACIMHKSETDWMHARGQPASQRARLASRQQLAGFRVSTLGYHPKVNKPPIAAPEKRAENVATLALKLNCGLTSVLLVTEERRCSPRKVDTERARIYLSTSFRGAMDAVTVAQDRVDTLGSLMFESVGEVWQQAAPVPAASVMKDPSRSPATNVELGQAWALKMGAFHGLPDSIQVTGRW